MAKKKAKVETEIPEPADASEIELPAERVYKAGGKAVVLDANAHWEILYTPQWRAQIVISTDEPRTFDEAQKRASDEVWKAVIEFHLRGQSYPDTTPELTWNQIDENVWIATGNDGVIETTLPVVKLTRVVDTE